RRFVMVEMESMIAQQITRERLRRVIDSYDSKAKRGQEVGLQGTDGGFRYCNLGIPLFDNNGNITKEITFSELAGHVYFTETGEPIPCEAEHPEPLLGAYNGTAIYLLYNGILGDKTPQGGNVLTRAVLSGLPPFDGPKVIYGTSC